MNFKRLRDAAFGIMFSTASFVVAGCSSTSTPVVTATTCPAFALLRPQFVQELYPIPNASGISQNASLLIYASTQSVPIVLSKGSASMTLPVAKVPTMLPEPIASPSMNGQSLYAVSLPALNGETAYSVSATIQEIACNGSSPISKSVGTFKTQ